MTPSSFPEIAGLQVGWGAIIGIINTVLVAIIGRSLVQWVRSRPEMRKLERDGDARLIETLSARVDTVEQQLAESNRLREADRSRHEAEMQIMRHRANNSDQCLDALLLLLEAAPEKVSDAVSKIKEMRARQRDAEALEKGAMRAGLLATAGDMK